MIEKAKARCEEIREFFNKDISCTATVRDFLVGCGFFAITHALVGVIGYMLGIRKK